MVSNAAILMLILWVTILLNYYACIRLGAAIRYGGGCPLSNFQAFLLFNIFTFSVVCIYKSLITPLCIIGVIYFIDDFIITLLFVIDSWSSILGVTRTTQYFFPLFFRTFIESLFKVFFVLLLLKGLEIVFLYVSSMNNNIIIIFDITMIFIELFLAISLKHLAIIYQHKTKLDKDKT